MKVVILAGGLGTRLGSTLRDIPKPLLKVGVPRGPAPPFDSQNRTASRCLQTGEPVVRL